MADPANQVTTLGRLLLEQQVPGDLRPMIQDASQKSINRMMSEAIRKRPQEYASLTKRLLQLARLGMTELGGMSFGLKHLRPPEAVLQEREALREGIRRVIEDHRLSMPEKQRRVLDMLTEAQGRFSKMLLEQPSDNPLRDQVVSGARGNPFQLMGLMVGPVIYVDARDRLLPVPVLHSYAEGLRPHEYWASTYGARRGLMGTKFAVADAGALSKHINQTVHRGIIVGVDGAEPDTVRGLPVDVGDADSDGALLAVPVGGFHRNTLITPEVRAALAKQNIQRMLVRSPVASLASDGLYARDVGVREFGRLPVAGENVSMTAAQALGEPLQQGQLSARHTSGQAGQTGGVISGFGYIERMFQIPPTSPLWASLASKRGRVSQIVKAPAGGHYVVVGGVQHFVRPEQKVAVQVGDEVEAGDVLSDGVPNPAEVTELKGIGEARRYFVQQLTSAMRNMGIKVHRRNTELVARYLIDNVEMTDTWDDYLEGDIVPYELVAERWRPRADAKRVKTRDAQGRYLEKPYLHYSIGTQVTPRVIKELEEFGVNEVIVHDVPPPWRPKMVRAIDHLSYDPDWQTRLFGSTLQRSLLRAAHRGATSDRAGTSFVPGLVRAVDFGHEGLVRTPQPAAS